MHHFVTKIFVVLKLQTHANLSRKCYTHILSCHSYFILVSSSWYCFMLFLHFNRLDCMTAAAKRYKYLRRLVKFRQMDFEFAFWQMLYLFIAPQKVYRNFHYRKRNYCHIYLCMHFNVCVFCWVSMCLFTFVGIFMFMNACVTCMHACVFYSHIFVCLVAHMGVCGIC
jgi:hypothetical protein